MVPRVHARIAGLGRFAFGGLSRGAKTTAATILAAFFIAGPAPAWSPNVPGITQPTDRGPALWVVQDRDTTIYLFGTFHSLDSNANWFGPRVRAAFDASDELVLETLVPEDPAELFAALARTSLTREPRAGQPVVATEGAPSFVASAGQAMASGSALGMSVDHGADAVLRRAAGASGKPVGGLESFDSQLRMFGSLPPTPRTRVKQNVGDVSTFVGDMQSAWKRGDNDGIAVILGNVRSQSPLAYKTLFTDRNATWAGWIADRLAQPGTVFVAVGTGHLVGPDSVQRYLAARGIASARIS